ncbi:hypothetical protein BDW02DRAFT_650312 [Decorospora gaudefroyi]|uniref:Uncharacterized protein n=1 Tax=Decorospora gaudefroyi TaxID=184978 RepID=A0A6A5K0R9_9PLEO|nr:hypothetical protein BDW02DRAFT_650312 [Decorospora gaudefroyi]
MKFLAACVFVVSALISVGICDCFYPDGRNATDLHVCLPDAAVSHCCRSSDSCLSNGMCFSSGLGSIVRRACTDKTWKSQECPRICTDTLGDGDAALTPCGPYNSFCCGHDEAARECCDTGNSTLAVQVAGGDVVPWPTITIESPPAGSPSTPSSTTSSLPADPNTQSNETQRNTLIGLTATFGVAMLVLAALAIFWFTGMRKQKQRRQAIELEKLEIVQEKQAVVKEKQAIETEKTSAEKENQALQHKIKVVDDVIASMPGPFKKEFMNAKRKAGFTT